MRDFKGMKRQRGRNRGGGGGGGGGKPQHNANRAFDSNGPDGVKVRGAAQHIFEKYTQFARDASASGDRVLAENYLQHAEHYFRVLRAMQPQRPLSEIMGREQFASGYDIDFEEEPQPAAEQSETEAYAEGPDGEGRRDDRGWSRDERPREDRQRSDGQRDDRPRDDRAQGDFRQAGRDDRPRDDRPRDDRPRDDRPRDDRPRDDRPRDDRGQGDFRQRDDRGQGEFRPRDDRPREDRGQGDFRGRDDRPRDRFARDDRPQRFNRDDRRDRPERAPDRDPLGVVEPQATPLTGAAPAYEPPREPRGGVLRSDDGVSQAPAFLQARAPEIRAEERDEPVAETPRPRRRRAPKSFEAPDGAAPTESDEG
ncbi:MAG: DUF4167 domain-containing protein [Caulobacterales bacterium]